MLLPNKNRKPLTWYSAEELALRMPPVGTQVKRRLYTERTQTVEERPISGTVVYVNEAHLFYRVRFDNGCTESYKAI